MCSDYATWQLGNEVGYQLTRYKIKQDSQVIRGIELQDTRFPLLDGTKPLSESEWTSFEDNKFARVAKGDQYEADSSVVMSGTPCLAEIVNQEESQNARFVFALFTTEMDFEVAKGMALGYKDEFVEGSPIERDLPNRFYKKWRLRREVLKSVSE